MRRAAWMLLGVLAVAAVIVAAPQPPPPERAGEGWESPVAVAMAGTLEGGWPRGQIDCSTCHYGFVPGFEVEALRIGEAARATYALNLSPVSGYELAAAWAAPRRAGDGLAEPLSVHHRVELPGLAQPLTLPVDLPWPAAALVVEAWNADGEARAPFALELAGPDGAFTQGVGGPAHQHAWAVAGPGEALEGAWEAVVRPLDPADAGKPLVVLVHMVPLGYEVRTDDGSATGTRGKVQGFAWELPAPGEEGAPERLHVAALAFNLHPWDKWKMPVEGDRGFYEGNLSAREAAPPPAPGFTAEDLEVPWAGGEAVPIFDMAFDGLRVRTLNERGERLHRDVRLDLQLDPACPACYLEVPHIPPFPPLPPGTTYVRTELTWEPRDPLGPTPQWFLATSQRPEPDFRYPEPTEAGPGRMVHVIPVQPVEWEREGESWFQAAPLLRPDANGLTVFDGKFAFSVTAHRGPLPGG